MVDAEKTSCNCCRELINNGASICPHCGRNQKWIVRILAPTPQWIALFISLTLCVLSWRQFDEAKKQRISADDAFNKATVVERRVTKIAKATLPLFESLLVKTGRADGGYTSAEREKLTKALKDALIENKADIDTGVRP